LLKWKGNVSLPKGYKKTDTVKYVFENENERIKEWYGYYGNIVLEYMEENGKKELKNVDIGLEGIELESELNSLELDEGIDMGLEEIEKEELEGIKKEELVEKELNPEKPKKPEKEMYMALEDEGLDGIGGLIEKTVGNVEGNGEEVLGLDMDEKKVYGESEIAQESDVWKKLKQSSASGKKGNQYYRMGFRWSYSDSVKMSEDEFGNSDRIKNVLDELGAKEYVYQLERGEETATFNNVALSTSLAGLYDFKNEKISKKISNKFK